jgi:hypothetical protein
MTCYLIKPPRLVRMPLNTSHYSEMLVLCNSQADCYTFALRIGAKVVHSVYSSYGLGNRNSGSIPDKGKSFIPFSIRPDRLRGSPRLIFNSTGIPFPEMYCVGGLVR